ncbi:SPOR domain-containing protein [Ruegeria halocynthiae]|uniref:SPOR domain-containing protein n=1 Tax=Ruegeria halocynthiae TaxID=985054 RepID=UPI000568F81D|nr:SPOR domain-containing protein [Ruegeria halocynthiae]
MKRATETRVNPRSLAVLAVALVVLAGCDETLSPDGVSAEAEQDDAGNDGKIELFPDFSNNKQASVEAPDVFEVTEAGLWDGRPSLGGIWVAHPDVTQPERVVIKNTTNKKTINGALFRRERNLPGPALQLSSAAAEKLGILAGAPTKVQVIALRRKQVEQKPAEPEATPEPEIVADAKNETPAAVDAKPQTDAADAPVTETEKPAKRKWWQKKKPVAATGATAAVAATAPVADATASVAEAEAAAENVAETAARVTPAPTLSDPDVTAPAEKPAKRKWWQKKPRNEITETPLDPIAGAAAAIEATAPTPVAAGAAATSSLSKPFVQVGTYNVEANAKSAADKIRRNGLPANVRELKKDDKLVWRVLVGPASTRSERNAIHNDVKDLGFTDAFTVKN